MHAWFPQLVQVLRSSLFAGVGCITCTEKVKELQKALDSFLVGDVTVRKQCPTTSDIQSCQKELTELTKELHVVRNASVLVKNVSVNMGRTWQYRQSRFNQSYTTVDVINIGAVEPCIRILVKIIILYCITIFR